MHRLWHLIGPLLDATQARSVLEIGTDNGTLSRLLLARAAPHGGTVHSIDITETTEVQLLRQQAGSSFIFHHGSSLDVLPSLTNIDAILIDGDHNWYTILGELRAVAALAERQGSFPLVLLHDTAWPYGRRDMYYAPSSIPPPFRHPHGRRGLHPTAEGVTDDGGFNSGMDNALWEGGARNGVRTAVEDWLAEIPDPPRFVIVSGLHGLGILAPAPLLQRAPAIAALLHDLTLSASVTAHLHAIEQDRLLTLIRLHNTLGESKREREGLLREREGLLREREGLLRSLKESAATLRHTLQTRSWRWTALLRRAERCVRGLRYVHFPPIRLLRTRKPDSAPEDGTRISGTPSIAALVWNRRIVLPRLSPASVTDRTPDLIIPTHNHSAHTLRCIASILAHTQRFRIIWVDNGSSAEHIAAVQSALRDVPHIPILHPQRLGFVRAANIGIAASENATIVLLNNDTEVTAGWLTALLHPFDRDPAIGITGPVTDAPHSWQGNAPRGHGHRIVAGMVAFFCAAIDRDVIRRIGYLSEEFGEGFGDDDDYCARARADGWKVALVQDAFVRHAHRTTFHSLHRPEAVQRMIANATALFRCKQYASR